MSTYFITTEQAETSEIFECMESFSHNCNCGQSYALKADYESDGSIAKDIFIVCDCCTENNPRDAYFDKTDNLKNAIVNSLKNSGVSDEFIKNNFIFTKL